MIVGGNCVTEIAGEDAALTVFRDKVSALRSGQAIALPANCLIAASAVVVLWPRAPHQVLWAWLALMVICNATRLLALRLLARSRSARILDRALGLSWGGSLVSGGLWIVPLLLCENIRSEEGTYLLFMVSGVTAGAVVQHSAHAATPIAFAAPLLSTVFVMAMQGGRTADVIFAANIVFYAAMLVRSAIAGQRTLEVNSRRRHEAIATAASLEAANRQIRESAQALESLANRDPLTGLGNRAAFTSALARKLAPTHEAPAPFSLLMIDLDFFKSINDTLGHGAGDFVLTSLAERMQSSLRGSDQPGRLGGDEFGIILTDQNADEAVAERLIKTLSEPLTVRERSVSVGVSIGIARYPADGTNEEELLMNADLALYAAKDGGRKQLRRFDVNLREARQERQGLEFDLEAALDEGQLEVWFQPQVRLSDRRLVGFEALIRWRHPERGWIAPPNIIVAAAATHRSAAVTGLVANEACGLLRRLAAAGREDVTVSVNISPTEIGTYDLRALLETALTTNCVPARLLEIEVTEEAMIASERVARALSDLAQLGVRLAIDDFGTGYASLASLRKLEFGRIKIDKSFVYGIHRDQENQVLVEAMLGIARSLELSVVAEGLETEEDERTLVELGCDVAQGYLFAAPMAAGRLLDWMDCRDQPLAAGSPKREAA